MMGAGGVVQILTAMAVPVELSDRDSLVKSASTSLNSKARHPCVRNCKTMRSGASCWWETVSRILLKSARVTAVVCQARDAFFHTTAVSCQTWDTDHIRDIPRNHEPPVAGSGCEPILVPTRSSGGGLRSQCHRPCQTAHRGPERYSSFQKARGHGE